LALDDRAVDLGEHTTGVVTDAFPEGTKGAPSA
jgi:hypothetical protein